MATAVLIAVLRTRQRISPEKTSAASTPTTAQRPRMTSMATSMIRRMGIGISGGQYTGKRRDNQVTHPHRDHAARERCFGAI